MLIEQYMLQRGSGLVARRLSNGDALRSDDGNNALSFNN
jgi:hypothetical protein